MNDLSEEIETQRNLEDISKRLAPLAFIVAAIIALALVATIRLS